MNDVVTPVIARLLRREAVAPDDLAVALASIEALEPAQLTHTVHIRGEAFLAVEALNRLVTHLAYHVGQIVYVGRHLAGTRWTTLSIPKGQSKSYGTGTYKDGAIPRKRH